MPGFLQRIRPWFLFGTVLTYSLIPQAAAAGSVHTVLDGKPLEYAVAPIVVDQRTLVMARPLLEAMGATVGWEQATKTVTARFPDGRDMRITIGNQTGTLNGEPFDLLVAPRIVETSTFIPLRAVMEELGVTVGWDGATGTVQLQTRSGALADRDVTSQNRAAAAAVATAISLKGTQYAWGGISPVQGFDCSGFVYYVAKSQGVTLPRSSFEQYNVGVKVDRANLQAGDLVFFETYAPGASHVGIYDGKGSFIHSQNEATGVISTPMSSSWWAPRYLGARRIFR